MLTIIPHGSSVSVVRRCLPGSTILKAEAITLLHALSRWWRVIVPLCHTALLSTEDRYTGRCKSTDQQRGWLAVGHTKDASTAVVVVHPTPPALLVPLPGGRRRGHKDPHQTPHTCTLHVCACKGQWLASCIIVQIPFAPQLPSCWASPGRTTRWGAGSANTPHRKAGCIICLLCWCWHWWASSSSAACPRAAFTEL
jgi:hypothetical protein